MQHANADAVQRLAADPSRGPIAMLNLLKFKADGGQERYSEYVAAVMPLLEKIGARVIYLGTCGELVIGNETWDRLAVVEYPNAGEFVGMLRSDEYLAIEHLREESLDRSVLYQTEPVTLASPNG